MTAIQCAGCQKEIEVSAAHQCPLCQAMESTDSSGYFCSQECFAGEWLQHREEFHKKGVVKVSDERRKKRKREEEELAVEAAAKLEELQKEEAAEAERKRRTTPWPILDTATKQAVSFKPQLLKNKQAVKDLTRCVVRVVDEGDSSSLWPACIAVAKFLQSVASVPSAPDAAVPFKGEYVIVGKAAVQCSAMAWALRNFGIVQFSLAVSTAEAVAEDPNASTLHFHNGSNIAIVSADVLRTEGKEVGASCPQWGQNRLLITLPGVSKPDELQTLSSRALFLMDEAAIAESEMEHTHLLDVEGIARTAPITQSAFSTFSHPNEACFAGQRFNDELCTMLARGNLIGALDKVVNIFSSSKGKAEDIFFNALLLDWGCQDHVVFHHKLAYMMRYLCDRNEKFEKGSISLAKIATNAIVKVCRLVPELTKKDSADLAKKTVPNVVLRATVTYLFSDLTAPLIDSLGDSWGFDRCVMGMEKIESFNRRTATIVKRLKAKYAAKEGTKGAAFLVVLTHFIYELTSKTTLTVQELDDLTKWSVVVAHSAGPLREFLLDIEVLSIRAGAAVGGGKSGLAALKTAAQSGNLLAFLKPPELSSDKKNTNDEESDGAMLSSRKKKKSGNSNVRNEFELPTTYLPLGGLKERKENAMRNAATHEILMAMPKGPTPMYVGDVGNLIGQWNTFNAKYDGKLGVSLSQFMLSEPTHFSLVGNVVTRVKAGVSEQIKIRHDEDGQLSDDEEETSRKRRDQKLLTGMGIKGKGPGKTLHRKARRDLIKKQRNTARYNKNQKKFDPEAKVPGYKKHGPRKVKGRGRKTNIRTSKRAA